MVHPVLETAHTIREALKATADLNPTFMDTTDKAAALRELARLESQVAELRLRILADADDVASEAAARDAAAWLAHQTRGRPDEARSDLRLARSLDRRHPVLTRALREGAANLAQAHVIVRALDALPDEVDAGVRDQAEQTLVGHAVDFGPRQLHRLGRRILDVVAPEIAEEVEGRRLAELERTAAAATRLTLRRVGDGTTRITGLLPDAAATRLATYLSAFANPRRAADPEGEASLRLPHPRRLGDAFCQLLEAFDPDRLPLHGGVATTVVVTIPFDTLRHEVGAAEILGGAAVPGPDGSGEALSAGQVRRLACRAGVLPAVLGGRSEVLDLGRRKRLFSRKQRMALLIRDRTCRAEGCEIPGAWCEAHHWDPWSTGGHTDLADGVLLCAHHHHRVHEPRWRGERLPDGGVRFHRRE